MATQTHLPSHWQKRVLGAMDCPNNHENNRLLQAWAQSEGGNAKWNPLNSTMRLSGSVSWTLATNYNSVGVCNYLYGIAGVCAMALTLEQRDWYGDMLYGGIVTDMKAGKKTAEQIVNDNAKEFDLWGTGTHLILEVLAGIP
jgi:hypothetical protein